MQVAIFGNKNITLALVDTMVRKGYEVVLITLSSIARSKHKIADEFVISNLTGDQLCKIVYADFYDLASCEKTQHVLQTLKIPIGFCYGWQRLIPQSILQNFEHGVWGMHGSAKGLPSGRGRSPLNWSILEGQKAFKTSLFQFNVGADNGGIYKSRGFAIRESDTAKTLHIKNFLIYERLIEDLLFELKKTGAVNLTQQASYHEPTYYPKRSDLDGIINWNHSIHSIDRLIRSAAKPFHGALCAINSKQYRIYSASILFDNSENFESSYSNGMIVWAAGKEFAVECIDGVLLITDHDIPYTMCLSSVGSTFDTLAQPNSFPRNEEGHFCVKTQ